MKRLAHQICADVGSREACRIPNCYLDGLEGSKNSLVIVATRKAQPNLFRESRMQKRFRELDGFSERTEPMVILQGLSATGHNKPAIAAVRLACRHNQPGHLQPVPCLSERHVDLRLLVPRIAAIRFEIRAIQVWGCSCRCEHV